MSSQPTVVVSYAGPVENAVDPDALEAAGIRVVERRARSPGAVVEAVGSAEALVVDARTPVTREVLGALESLRVVARLGIGVDNIDIAAAGDHGVTVVHTPGYCVDEVSTHAIALLLSMVRSIPSYDTSVRAGEWDWGVGEPLFRFQEQTVGIVGFGKIGRAVAAKLGGFGVRMLAHDPYVDDDVFAEYGVTGVGFEALLAAADAVTIHTPLTEETRGMFDAAAFQRMNDTAYLVNTGRGPVVDEAALIAALEAGEIAGAGLDVFEAEPLPDSPLRELEHVVLTPHAAWYSEESIRERTDTITADVISVIHDDDPQYPVSPEADW